MARCWIRRTQAQPVASDSSVVVAGGVVNDHLGAVASDSSVVVAGGGVNDHLGAVALDPSVVVAGGVVKGHLGPVSWRARLTARYETVQHGGDCVDSDNY